MRLIWPFLAIAQALVLSVAAHAIPREWTIEWPNTDFSQLTVDAGEIISGGVPKDGIPAISGPQIISASEENRLAEREPVIAVEINDSWRAYPIRYLLWHEIVNDQLSGTPIAVTYCPLCNSAVVFDRRVDGELRSFGVTGKLRFSDMIMYDRETESWWQQAVGEGIAGVHAGDSLTVLPALTMGWKDYLETAGSAAEVIAEPRYPRPYGANPYVGYDTSDRPFLYIGENPPHDIHPLARVVRVGDKAWPLERLQNGQIVTEAGYHLDWQEGQRSPLDTRDLQLGREIGTVRVRHAGTDELAAHDILFAFAFHAFFPEGEWMLGE
ncbi:MAG: DUF3179 domain-containing protein [Rhodobacteraceae bacterium]|nr:DUF3179 domain-containing protein [Paracoccaceae bacterium]MCY4196763.1 DUF3179 domain-containing protein [Paracoccaceae bacterium]